MQSTVFFTRIFFFSIVTLFLTDVNGQSVTVNESPQVSKVMDQFAAINRMSEFIPGWRIQLLSTTDRRKMESTKEVFAREFPTMQIDFQHTPPYYKLRTGAFKTKLDALPVMHLIKKEIPGAYTTKDMIRSRELID